MNPLPKAIYRHRHHHLHLLLLAIASSIALTSCGGANTAKPEATAKATEDEDEVSASGKAAAAAAEASKPATQSNDPISLESLLAKGAKPTDFPKKTAADKDCYRTVALSGKHDADYDALIAACGPATGMKEYTKKITGKLDEKHPRDTYVVKMLAGFCYRFYAVGDPGIENIDIRVQRPTGALLSMDQSKQAIAILDPEEPWCKHHDREFQFVVEAQKGSGNYTFGVWARPGSK